MVCSQDLFREESTMKRFVWQFRGRVRLAEPLGEGRRGVPRPGLVWGGGASPRTPVARHNPPIYCQFLVALRLLS